MFGVRASRRAVIVAASVAVLAIVLFALRHVIVRTALETGLSVATGYGVRIGAETIGTRHATFFDVHLVKDGDPVLDARRIDVDYALRDVFPGGEHRYGFAAVAIQRPVLTITRHPDGSLTFARRGGTPATPPAPTRAAVEPLYFTARVRDGTIRLVDDAPRESDLRVQTIENVALDASVKSDARTTLRLDGALLGRRAQTAPLVRYPLAVRSVIDVPRGIALNHLTARELPLRGLLDFLVHTPAVRFADGLLDDVDVDAYALAPKANDTFDYTLGGSASLRDGRLVVGALAKPVRDLRGPVVIAGDTIAVPAIAADAAGIPIHGRGALFSLFTQPAFRIAIAGDADVRALRTLFTFSAKQPMSGPIHLETLMASQLAHPLIRSTIVAPRFTYDRYPVDALSGTIDYYDGSIVMSGVQARFGSIAADLGGRILIGARGGDDLAFVVAARGPGRSLPYADVIAPQSDLRATVLLTEPPGTGFTARGTIALDGPTAGAGTFAVDPKGVGEFGPFDFGTAAGASLAGGFELQRPISQSAGWLHARAFPLADVRRAALGLPGVRVPGFPPISGTIDGDFAGGGTPDAFEIAGAFSGRGMRAADYVLGDGSVRLGGSLSDLRLGEIRLSGPLGRFAGDGAFDGTTFGLQGEYDGALADLSPFTGPLGSRGEVHAPVRAALIGDRVVVQTGGAELAGGSIHGIPIRRMTGTLAVDGKALRIIAADGTLAGGRAVAADTGGPFLVSAPDLSAAALRGAGLPVGSGTGRDLRPRRLARGAALRRHGAPRRGRGRRLSDQRRGRPRLPGYDGTDSPGRRGARRDLRPVRGERRRHRDERTRRAGVRPRCRRPDRRDRRAPQHAAAPGEIPRGQLFGASCACAATARVRGSRAPSSLRRARSTGWRSAPRARRIAVTPGALAAHDGTVTVGSTRAAVDAVLAGDGRSFEVGARSANADLADFDDYFDEAETLDGRGHGRFRVRPRRRRDALVRAGRSEGAALPALPVRGYRCDWSQRGAAIVGALAVSGPHGALRANGSISPGSGDPLTAFRTAAVHGTARAERIDLGTWLPALGVQAPILGRLSASGTVAGRWPRLALNGDASLADGKIDGFAIRAARVHASGDGDRIAIAGGTVDLGFAAFTASGSFGLARSAPLALAVEATTPDLATALATVRPRGPRYPIGGAATANALIGGTFAAPRATVGFELTGAHYASLQVPHVLGSVGYDGRTLTINDAEATFAKGSAVLAGTLPVSLRPLGIDPTTPLSFSLSLDALDLGPFAPFVPGPNGKLGGIADGRLEIEGTARAPRVVGTIGLANGFYVSDLDRAGVTKANAQLAFSGTTVALEALHASVGGGTLTGSGRLDLPFPGAPLRGYAIALTARGARLDTPLGRGTVDGSAQLESTARIPTLGGNLTLSNASIPFAALYKLASQGAGTAASGPPFDLAFDLVARAGRNVRVQSSIMDIGAAGTLNVDRDGAAAADRGGPERDAGERLLDLQPRLSGRGGLGDVRSQRRRRSVHRSAGVRARHQPGPRPDPQRRGQRRHHDHRRRAGRRDRQRPAAADLQLEPAVLAGTDRGAAPRRFRVRRGQLRPAAERDEPARRAAAGERPRPARRDDVPGRRDQLQRGGVLGAERPAHPAFSGPGRARFHRLPEPHRPRAHRRLRRRGRLPGAQADRPPRRLRELRTDAGEPDPHDRRLHRAARCDHVGLVQLLRPERQPGDHELTVRVRLERHDLRDAAPGDPAALLPARVHLFDRPEVSLRGPPRGASYPPSRERRRSVAR